MTTFHIQAPSTLQTSISLSASKSISNRALVLNALCKNPKPLINLASCDDTETVIQALTEKKDFIDVGAAGTAMRFLTAYFSAQPGHFTLTGTERMKNRPIKLLVNALRSVGASIEYLEKEGYPPLYIKGQSLKGGEIEIDGGISSQYISALLMMAPLMTNGLRLHLTGRIISMSYIHITIQLMRQFGVSVFHEGAAITVPPQSYTSIEDFVVESDWSAASYWYEMVALCNNNMASVSLSGLRPDSLQGDAGIISLFDTLGVETTFTASGITLSKKQRDNMADYDSDMARKKVIFEYDFTMMPDMAQTAVVTCAMLHIPFRFTGLQSLKIKETDRLCALRTELFKLGYLLEIQNDDTLIWRPDRPSVSIDLPSIHAMSNQKAKLQLCTLADKHNVHAIPSLQASKQNDPPVIVTYDDHRMAMSFAPVSLCEREGIKIIDPEVVSKSYPTFWDDMKKANFLITQI